MSATRDNGNGVWTLATNKAGALEGVPVAGVALDIWACKLDANARMPKGSFTGPKRKGAKVWDLGTLSVGTAFSVGVRGGGAERRWHGWVTDVAPGAVRVQTAATAGDAVDHVALADSAQAAADAAEVSADFSARDVRASLPAPRLSGDVDALYRRQLELMAELVEVNAALVALASRQVDSARQVHGGPPDPGEPPVWLDAMPPPVNGGDWGAL